MTRYVGLDVSQRMTAICIVDEAGHRLWRGQCRSVPSEIEKTVRQHAGEDARIGIETGSMTPWPVHELRSRSLEVVCLDARHARAALKMQINKTDQNDARRGARWENSENSKNPRSDSREFENKGKLNGRFRGGQTTSKH